MCQALLGIGKVHQYKANFKDTINVELVGLQAVMMTPNLIYSLVRMIKEGLALHHLDCH